MAPMQCGRGGGGWHGWRPRLAVLGLLVLVLTLFPPCMPAMGEPAACADIDGGEGGDRLDRLEKRMEQLEEAMHEIRDMMRESMELTRRLLEQQPPRQQCVDGGRHNDTLATVRSALPERTINFIYGLWDDKPMRPEFAANIESWKALNPTWAVRVWNRTEIKDFWRKEFPEYRSLWAKTLPIQRADIARLMIVFRHGGLYADLDCAPTKAIDDIFQLAGYRSISHDTVVCVEDIKNPQDTETSSRWPIRNGIPEYPTRIANYVFWAKPGSKVLARALATAKERVERLHGSEFYHAAGRPDAFNFYSIIYSTGPDVMTEAVFSAQKKDGTRTSPAQVVVIPPGECSMNNQATGSWIGDTNPAVRPGSTQKNRKNNKSKAT